jgi:hypothetical protein
LKTEVLHSWRDTEHGVSVCEAWHRHPDAPVGLKVTNQKLYDSAAAIIRRKDVFKNVRIDILRARYSADRHAWLAHGPHVLSRTLNFIPAFGRALKRYWHSRRPDDRWRRMAYLRLSTHLNRKQQGVQDEKQNRVRLVRSDWVPENMGADNCRPVRGHFRNTGNIFAWKVVHEQDVTPTELLHQHRLT